MELKLEVGKKYVDRLGYIVEIIFKAENDNSHPYVGQYSTAKMGFYAENGYASNINLAIDLFDLEYEYEVE